MNRELNTIVCPICGQEYLPSEIFFPNDLLGKPTEIIKNDRGKIEFYLGEDQNLNEEYICDNCGAKLNVQANISYKVEVETENFEEEYESTFVRPKKLKLEESSLFD